MVGRRSRLTLRPGFAPDSEREARLLAHPLIRKGLAWGEPREGHPEGTVAQHVADLLATIDAWEEVATRREELRFLALVHDSFKFAVSNLLPKVGGNHHGMRARRFAERERFTDDERLLATLELHDRPYAIWRWGRRSTLGQERAVDRLAARIPDRELFLRFVELDASTDGKRPEPVEWIRRELSRRSAAG